MRFPVSSPVDPDLSGYALEAAGIGIFQIDEKPESSGFSEGCLTASQANPYAIGTMPVQSGKAMGFRLKPPSGLMTPFSACGRKEL
jgi:hypothetical protein